MNGSGRQNTFQKDEKSSTLVGKNKRQSIVLNGETMEAAGVQGDLHVQSIQSWLHARKQWVVIEGCSSDWRL